MTDHALRPRLSVVALLLLTTATGAIDAVSYLGLDRVFTGNMTGNVLFLGFAFHGPSAWQGNPMEFGFFVDHFVFIAGLLYAAVHGPGWPALGWTLPWLAARRSAPPPPGLR